MSEFDKDTIYKEIRPANQYDVAANETWLEDMARKGYRLTGFTGWNGVFQKTEPFTCRYRMQPLHKKEKEPDWERRTMYSDLGWVYVATVRETFHIWRCDDPNAPELDTDPVVQGMGYGYLKRKMVRDGVKNALFVALLLAILPTVNALLPGTFNTPVLDILIYQAPGELALWLLAMLLSLVSLGCQVRSARRLMRSLNAGEPLDRPRSYRRQKWLARCLMASFICFWIILLVGDLRTINGDSLTRGWDAYDRGGVPKPEVVYVDLRALDGVTAEPVFFGVETKVHELAPRMYRAEQYAEVSADTQLTARTEYYHMLTAGLARELGEELTQARRGSFGIAPHPELETIPTPELDGLWWCRTDSGTQYAAALLGRNVLFLWYDGPTDLRTRGAYFAELLAR